MPLTTMETAKKLEESKEKFYMSNFDSDKKVMYLKKQGGGACIAKSNMAFVIGVFSTSKKMKFDGKEENQNPRNVQQSR